MLTTHHHVLRSRIDGSTPPLPLHLHGMESDFTLSTTASLLQKLATSFL